MTATPESIAAALDFAIVALQRERHTLEKHRRTADAEAAAEEVEAERQRRGLGGKQRSLKRIMSSEHMRVERMEKRQQQRQLREQKQARAQQQAQQAEEALQALRAQVQEQAEQHAAQQAHQQAELVGKELRSGLGSVLMDDSHGMFEVKANPVAQTPVPAAVPVSVPKMGARLSTAVGHGETLGQSRDKLSTIEAGVEVGEVRSLGAVTHSADFVHLKAVLREEEEQSRSKAEQQREQQQAEQQESLPVVVPPPAPAPAPAPVPRPASAEVQRAEMQKVRQGMQSLRASIRREKGRPHSVSNSSIFVSSSVSSAHPPATLPRPSSYSSITVSASTSASDVGAAPKTRTSLGSVALDDAHGLFDVPTSQRFGGRAMQVQALAPGREETHSQTHTQAQTQVKVTKVRDGGSLS
eukprot:CAMPEP_0173236128 /NCGR_PEP_ID=MMETSP1142-20121109/11253_1 /TAXON_ID=483371 /ORGANISM="non described non described, Strain CCMP2298" /LENGTH=411 /DNA_ID=CAMNT_0014166533 /DNA_START=60 /DNA_END=1292 /DNA_ORIENTATION=-